MASSLNQKHPGYTEQLPNWILMRDAYKGERAVKEKKFEYLPATSGQIEDGMANAQQKGWKDYDAYRKRARFHNFVRESVQIAIGMMHSHPPKIELPKAMEGILSTKGETLPLLLRRINEQQLLVGRIGLLLDLPSKAPVGRDLPYIATYSAERIINWDDGEDTTLIPQKLNLVVLDESSYVRDADFAWSIQEKYRVLMLGELRANEPAGTYRVGVFEDNFIQSEMKTPSWRGKTLDEIPFLMVNSCDLVVEPDEPPLLDLGNLCMTIYRSEADYRQNLFMQGQDTLVVIGAVSGVDEDEALRVGAGARIEVPMGGDAKYIGVESDGLSEQREALQNDRQMAGSMGAQTLDTVSRERESGASLKIRVAARTADLNQIALTGAKGLEDLLKIGAKWMGANPEEVSVEPNLEFDGEMITGQSMVEMQTARNLGYPISARSLHQRAYDKGMTTMTFEEEMEAAKAEKETIFSVQLSGDMNPEQNSPGNGSQE